MLTFFPHYRRLSGRKEWLQWTSFEGFRRIAWFHEPHFGASFKVIFNEFNETNVPNWRITTAILIYCRQFLWSFRLPGEAQKIDRMMECFAQRYCQLNPDIFTNTDTCYVLSFAIIMLNTSLHNPSVKDKPSVEQFISMNRGINNGGDLPRELLVSLFESIKTEPFKIPQDDGNDLMHTFFNPDKEGWLWKQGGR